MIAYYFDTKGYYEFFKKRLCIYTPSLRLSYDRGAHTVGIVFPHLFLLQVATSVQHYICSHPYTSWFELRILGFGIEIRWNYDSYRNHYR